MQEKARIQAMMGEDLLFLTDDQLRRGIEAIARSPPTRT